MFTRLIIQQPPYKASFMPAHRHCRTAGHIATVYSKNTRYPLLAENSGEMDAPCWRAVKSALEEQVKESLAGTREHRIYWMNMYVPTMSESLVLRFGEKQVEVPSGSYVIVNPKDHDVIDSSQYAGSVVSFSQLLLRECREMAGIPKSLGPFDFSHAPRRLTGPLKKAIDQLVELGGRPSSVDLDVWRPSLMAGLATKILAELWWHHPSRLRDRLNQTGFRHALDPRLDRAIHFLHEHYQAPFAPVRLAKESGLSLASLKRIFQRDLGMSPGTFLRRFRIDHATRMMMESPKPNMSEIAFQVGFGSATALRKAYLAVRGTPLFIKRI